MKNKKILTGALLIASLTLFKPLVFSQDDNYYKKLESMRIAFFTERLSLTSSEAEKFWPLYRDYNNRKEKINEERRSLDRYIMKNGDYLTEKEVNESMGKYLSLQKEEPILSETYNQKFLDVLPAIKVLKIYMVENQFKAYILNQIRANRPTKPGPKDRNF